VGGVTGPVAVSPTAHTLPGQALVNRLVRGMLRTPFVCRLLGRRLLTIYVVGRRSGRHYPVPVAYCHHQGRLLVATQFRWIRNLRSGEPVQIRLMGRRREADTAVLTEETEVVELLALMARENHGFARFNSIGIDEQGEPRREDLERAWRGGARVAALSPH
jgi:deazaflavin-dependent oxidoreductase (nitroreductase family)